MRVLRPFVKSFHSSELNTSPKLMPSYADFLGAGLNPAAMSASR